jgi:F-type H+-transporting ATPase subunit gamma
MPSLKLIKRRRDSASSTQQIMKAMNLVATSKLQKAKSRLDTIRPLFNETKRIMDNIEPDDFIDENIFVVKRDVERVAYIIITSDRGLCGGYNSNVSKEALAHMGDAKNERIISVGIKGWDYFRRRGKNIAKRLFAVTESAVYADAEKVGKLALEMFTAKDGVQEVYVAYTHFDSMMSHSPRVERMLPLDIKSKTSGEPMNYEPDAATFLADAIPMYVNVFIYGAMIESVACEQASRMISMDSAAKNADKIIDKLTLEFNRKRQGIITQEINEIVSGANALQ